MIPYILQVTVFTMWLLVVFWLSSLGSRTAFLFAVILLVLGSAYILKSEAEAEQIINEMREVHS